MYTTRKLKINWPFLSADFYQTTVYDSANLSDQMTSS